MDQNPLSVPSLRRTYTVEQFAKETLGGNRDVQWVRKECRIGKIEVVSRRPLLIPQSEAERFAGGAS
jgi:hypothetical protein